MQTLGLMAQNSNIQPFCSIKNNKLIIIQLLFAYHSKNSTVKYENVALDLKIAYVKHLEHRDLDLNLGS